ncbi:MAG: phage recombination protein Bet [Treponema sp.]|jgi:phage recombination protein Bet|nr:phage recombination protein Bet [Treponema sp.]
MSDIKSDNNQALTVQKSVTERELLEYLDTFSGTSALLPTEKIQFLNIAKAYGLNPFKKEIYAVAYGAGQYRKCSIITGYEVYLKRAEHTRLLDGWEANFSGHNEDMACHITIWRRDWSHPFSHSAYYSEAVQYKDGKPNTVWAKMPKTMLRKVAIGQAFRLCFPEEMGGMPYIGEEIGVEAERNITDPPHRSTEENRETLLKNIYSAEDRKKILESIKAMLEAKNPDVLPYFDEYEIRRWGDQVREIPKFNLEKLEEVRQKVYARLEKLKAEYKPVPFDDFDDHASKNELAAKEATESEATAYVPDAVAEIVF